MIGASFGSYSTNRVRGLFLERWFNRDWKNKWQYVTFNCTAFNTKIKWTNSSPKIR